MKDCLLFFVKHPERGKVKTRLAKAIGSERAVEFYKCFILDIVDTLSQLPQQVKICYAPEQSGLHFREWLGEHFLYDPQQGEDLGDRMQHAFHQAFQQGFENVVIIGSDLPDLPLPILEHAFASLDTHDAVIGPAADGGYYLLGFRQASFFPGVFEDMVWSTETVFEHTLHKIEEAGLQCVILPTWHDIDTFAELQQLCTGDSAETKQIPRHTLQYWDAINL